MFFYTLRAPLFALSAYAVGVLAVPAVSEATRDLSPANDFTQSGAGGYSIKPSNLSIHLDTGDALKLSRDLATLNLEPQLGFRRDCSKKQRDEFYTALDATWVYIDNAYRYVMTYGSNGPHYKHWFGKPGPGPLDTVVQVFTKLKSYNLVYYIVQCTCPKRGATLRLDPHNQKLFLCRDFWEFPLAGDNQSRAMLLISALSTVSDYGGLTMIEDGREEAEKLALRGDRQVYAVRNLDNYMEFIISVNKLFK